MGKLITKDKYDIAIGNCNSKISLRWTFDKVPQFGLKCRQGFFEIVLGKLIIRIRGKL